MGESSANNDDNDLPFEHIVLEAALRESTTHKQDRFARLRALIDGALWARASRNNTSLKFGHLFRPPEEVQGREHALYRLLVLSNGLQNLEVDVRRAESCLSTLISTDEDMAGMYLSHQRDH